jgi:hypothetical protein
MSDTYNHCGALLSRCHNCGEYQPLPPAAPEDVLEPAIDGIKAALRSTGHQYEVGVLENVLESLLTRNRALEGERDAERKRGDQLWQQCENYRIAIEEHNKRTANTSCWPIVVAPK